MTTVNAAPVAVFSDSCSASFVFARGIYVWAVIQCALAKKSESLDWTWGSSACIRNCALNAVAAVGCAPTYFRCICAKRAAFIATSLACIKNNCSVQLTDAQIAVDTSIVCPILDLTLTLTVPPDPTVIAI
ncbi:hypothetical protein BDZ97DRAFT_353235 [Flammula alnicola]|nr:hypothetical protein BDZ97DRAFT_353235 [Flammula alnicola]